MRSILVREHDFFVEEQSLGFRLDGGLDLGPEPLHGLLAAWSFDPDAEVDDDEVWVVG